jgi:hypothetical protein
MQAEATLALTSGVIAQRLDEPLHRVLYVIRSRDIQPTVRAGNARVFSEADAAFIASELRRIDEEREGVRQ